MRLLICASFLIVCLTSIPSIDCDRKYKLTEYTERDKHQTKDRYSKHDEDDVKFQTLKKHKRRDEDEDKTNDDNQHTKRLLTTTRRNDGDEPRKISKKDAGEIVAKKTLGKIVNARKHEESDENDDSEANNRKTNKKTVVKQIKNKQSEESDEDDDDASQEGDVSQSCRKRRGKACVSSNGDDTDEINEDDSEEDAPVKKRITYVKKFDHEKKKKGKDKEIGNILKMHKKSGVDDAGRRYRIDEDDDSSEEAVLPKRRRFVHEDYDD